jgi:hypothetical protein
MGATFDMGDGWEKHYAAGKVYIAHTGKSGRDLRAIAQEWVDDVARIKAGRPLPLADAPVTEEAQTDETPPQPEAPTVAPDTAPADVPEPVADVLPSSEDVDGAIGVGAGAGGEGYSTEPETDESLTDEIPIPESQAADESAEEIEGIVSGGDEAPAEEPAGSVESTDGGSTGGGLALRDEPGRQEPSDRDRDYAYDADFEEIGPPDLGAELLERHGDELNALPAPEASPDINVSRETPDESPGDQNRFYGLDDLDRRRSLRIGDVHRYAIEHAPILTSEQGARLTELRNFAMGVSEGRWPDEPDKRNELDGLEAILSHEIAWDTVLKAKVRFLNSAERDEVESFVVGDDWPD